MQKIQSTIQNIDLFSLPFKFTLGSHQKDKKTLFGGILSIIIGALSLVYLAYLCYLYQRNKMPPSTTIIDEYNDKEFSIHSPKDTLSVNMILSNGENLQDYHKRTGKVILHMVGILQYMKDGSQTKVQTVGIPCDSERLAGNYCFNYIEFPDGLTLTFRNGANDQFILAFVRCVPSLLFPGQICETNATIISSLLISLNSYLTVRLDLQQYNTNTKTIILKQESETYIFDDNLTFLSLINLQKCDTTINDGFLFQTPTDFRIISGYSRINMVASASSPVFLPLGMNPYGGIVISLRPNNIALEVSFPQITYLLAQFSSIFNSLLIFGFLSKVFAESEICNDMMALQLQVYYKLTALQLLSIQKDKGNTKICPKEQIMDEDPKGNNIDKVDDIAMNKTISPSKITIHHKKNSSSLRSLNPSALQFQKVNNQTTQLVQIKNKEDDTIQMKQTVDSAYLKNESMNNSIQAPDTPPSVPLSVKLYNKIQHLNFKSFFSKNMKISLPVRIYTYLFPSKKTFNKSEEYAIYQNLLSTSSNAFSAFDLQKDVLILKIMIRLLLSPEQYAAALLCGSRVQIQKESKINQIQLLKDNESIFKKQENQNLQSYQSIKNQGQHLLNHLEKIDKIEQDDEFMKDLLSKFVENVKNKSDIDLRIRDCMINQVSPIIEEK